MSGQPRMTDWRSLHDRADAAIVDEYRVLIRAEETEGKTGPPFVALQYVPADIFR